ncbi:MAG: putative 2-hydroxyacid dehydrogenase YoaD [Firmicutes bacterium ADurb.Bin300]|nr:MAG: putative 2-hydroxyacid dehydrogenase YoaD [Firmicutes bacterium ADurb.Bin300]
MFGALSNNDLPIAVFGLMNDKCRDEVFEIIKDALPEYRVTDDSDALSDEELKRVEIVCGKISKEKLRKMQSLKWLQLTSAGTNGYEKTSLYFDTKRLPVLTNARGVYTTPIAEYVAASMIMMSRSALSNNLCTRYSHRSLRLSLEQNIELQKSTVVIFGCGAIGRKIAEILKTGFLVNKIYGVDAVLAPLENFDLIVPLNESIKTVGEADFVINALPHTDETKNLFTLQYFSAMKKNCIFVNIGRGTTVVQKDLITALRKKLISGAVLDVSQPDPIPKYSTLRFQRRLLLTNHSSNYSLFNPERFNSLVLNQVMKYTRGEGLDNICPYAD